ncbi:lamin tail domain-containing protein [Hymenobacter latericus]|uniref:lamin tail domain-containing protein n=1 Tax=Hymenobacter sp. YIM 151858-1 TaxID=2987688 RepID=UPI002227FE23|nr:lamin tail domain-containing protein [Hymenobacter sp. YIM 151858-1]UYZ58813.1 lamin tail domain-containing protein [Hymenobacter sp. YIM 151858-1]
MLPRLLYLFGLMLLALPAAAQLAETFADGDFSQNPTWVGDAAAFQVNAQQQLQSNGPAVTGSQTQLATPQQAATGTTWEFWANLRLATSGGNLADVWLISEQADLKAAGNRGYFVRLGGTPDEVALFRKDATASPVYVINGQDGTLNSTTNNLVRVRVTRSPANVWTLERDLTGGRTFASEGTATDATYQRSQYLGVLLTYSAANNRNFYFDDFRVVDATPPQLVSATAVSATQVDVQFAEPVATSVAASSFRLGNGAVATAAQPDAADASLVHLAFGGNLPLGQNTLEVRNVADLFGNAAAGPLTTTFRFSGVLVAPGVNQVLITEILADETPQVGLPASEYLEIHNPSATNQLDLGGVRLLKPGSNAAAVFPAGAVLLPGEYAVVCASTRTAQFTGFGKVFGLTNFPSLTNTADQLLLRARDGRTLFEVRYADTWYRDNRKKEGGWALELIDLGNPCAGADNWQASLDASGGTPGRANSVQAANPDRTPPQLLAAVAVTATRLRLTFAEKLDSTLASNPALYRVLPNGPAVQSAAPVPFDFRTVELTLGAPLAPNQPYTVQVQRATDCVGNGTGPITSATIALPVPAAPGNVVINEVLFNPRSGGYDFVELLNRSGSYLSLQGWRLARELPDGSLDAHNISPEPLALAPGQLVVLSERPEIVQAQYPNSHEAAAFLPPVSLPSLPDDAGVIVLLDAQNRTIDRLAYAETMHLPLLDTRDGVSLERIRPDGPSTAANFHSAAGSTGYATPGRRNSQYQTEPGGDKQFALEPEVFTPDDDGQQDFATLSYRLDGAGYLASITVYDALGRLTRRLVRNETLATTGFFRWDGLTDANRKAAVGYYVLHIELFQPNTGIRREYKKTVVLGARL